MSVRTLLVLMLLALVPNDAVRADASTRDDGTLVLPGRVVATLVAGTLAFDRRSGG